MPLQQMPGKVTGGVHRLHDKAQVGKGGVNDHSLDSASGSGGPLMSHSVITKWELLHRLGPETLLAQLLPVWS